MSLHEMKGLTPHLTEVDLDALEGHTVLGEPLPVLMSVALRWREVSVRDGMTRIEATMTRDEGDALQRAMSRVVAPAELPPGHQDVHRVTVVLSQTCLAADAVVKQLLRTPA